MEEIYNVITDKLQIISEDQYLDSMHRLGKNGVIYKREGKKYYFVNDESDTNIENDQCYTSRAGYTNDRDIIEMIKEKMALEKVRNNEYINFLKNEIEFYKSELLHKNIIITTLLKSSEKVSFVETRQYIRNNIAKH